VKIKRGAIDENTWYAFQGNVQQHGSPGYDDRRKGGRVHQVRLGRCRYTMVRERTLPHLETQPTLEAPLVTSNLPCFLVHAWRSTVRWTCYFGGSSTSTGIKLYGSRALRSI